ncbi:MAG: PIN domain nuclease, partial [Acidobacteriaceae bacterium]
MDLLALRLLFILVLAAACWFFRPFGAPSWIAAITGAAAAAVIIFFELRVRALTLRRLFGAVIGSLLGIAGAFLFSLVLGNSLP